MDLLGVLSGHKSDSRYGVRVIKDALAPLAAPVNATKPHVDRGAMAVTAVLTTRTPDRQGDVVDPAGGDFGEHQTNPVVMFHHGKTHNLPIGKAEDRDGNYTVRLVNASDGDLLVGTTHFSQSDRFANDVFGLIAEDILRGVSIGFDPADGEDAFEPIGDSPVLDRPALHFKSWKLLEYSHTPIGVNRDALTVVVQKSLDGSRKLHPMLVKALQPYSTPRRTTVAVGKGCDIVPVNPVTGTTRPGRGGKTVKGRRPTKAGTLIPPAAVRKAMPDDYPDDDMDDVATNPDDAPAGGGAGFDPASDSPDEDPNLPAGASAMGAGDETPPTVQALMDASQGLMDLCGQLEAALKKGEHPGGRKAGAKLVAELRAKAGAVQQQAEKIHSELNGSPADDAGDGDPDGDPDADQNADEDAGEATEPPMPPETDDDGAVVTKGGYVPRRFTFADDTFVAQAPPRAAVPAELKALKAENDKLKAAMAGLLEDVEAARRRGR